MASNREKIRLEADDKDGRGVFYTTSINARKRAAEGKGKLEIKKYNKKLRKHVVFKQKKIK